jgi:hypothetical protein
VNTAYLVNDKVKGDDFRGALVKGIQVFFRNVQKLQKGLIDILLIIIS